MTAPAKAVEEPLHEPSYLQADSGIWSWLNTRDHKRIGVMFLVTVTGMFLLGGIFALALRTELLTPNRTIMDAMTYDRMFTLHGVTMVWLFLVPSIPTSFGNFLLPLQIGAKDLAFPKLNLMSFYTFVLGAVVTFAGMLAGGTDTGWTFYAPYADTTPTDLVPVVIGIFILGMSSIFSGINFIATTHLMRARGLRWRNSRCSSGPSTRPA